MHIDFNNVYKTRLNSKLLMSYLFILTTILILISLCSFFYFGFGSSKIDEFTNIEEIENYSKVVVKKSVKIYDIFLFSQECHMLAVRLYRLSPYVDKFIAITSRSTFSNGLQEIPACDELIEEYKSKIVFEKIKINSNYKTPQYRIIDLRRNIVTVVNKYNIQPDDLIIVSDVDEIPTREALDYTLNNLPIQQNPPFYSLCGPRYLFNYRLELQPSCEGVIFQYKDYKGDINRFRTKAKNGKNKMTIYPSQTHCEYCYPKYEDISNHFKRSSENIELQKYDSYESILRMEHCHTGFAEKGNFAEYKWKSNPLPNNKEFKYLIDAISISDGKDAEKITC